MIFHPDQLIRCMENWRKPGTDGTLPNFFDEWKFVKRAASPQFPNKEDLFMTSSFPYRPTHRKLSELSAFPWR